MSTQQDIYAAGSKNRPPMLNKENYVPWSSCLLRYAKSRSNGKLIYNSIMNGPYVRHDELTEKELKQVESDDQAIQTILLGLPEDIYATVDSCETAQEIWLRVQQMMKGSDIGIQEKKAKFLQPEWSHVTIVHQTKDLHTADYTQLYDFLKDNQKEIAQPGMNMGQDRQMQMVGGNGGNQFRQYTGQNVRNQNGYNAVQNVRNQVVQNAVKNPGVQNVGNQNGLIVVPGIPNQNPNGNGNVVAARAEGDMIGTNGNQIRCYNCRGLGHLARNYTVRPRRRDDAYLQTKLLIAQKEEAGIQLQAEEFDLMAAAADLDEIEEVNANYILMANLQQASTSGTQTDKAPIYDSDGSAELLEPIPEPHQVQHNDSNVISDASSMEQEGGIVDQHLATVEEIHAYYESLYNNLRIEVEKVNSVNRKMKETNVDLTTELARYKNQEKCFEISQEKYDKLERCYQKFVYQKQCLTKKINALHLSSDKQITTLNEEISNLNKQLSKEKSTVSSLLEEKKKLKSDFKIREDELLDKQIQLENKIKELDNILVKTEAAKFVRDFKSLANKAGESLVKHKALELEIKRLLRAVVSQDIMSFVQNNFVVDTSNLQTKLEPYNDMQQKIEQLQAQLGDPKGKSKDTPCVSDTLDPLPQKPKNKNVELEFQVRNYEKENAHLKTAYKNLFDSINVTRAQTKMITDSLQNKLHDTIYKNAKLRA
ncbi:hypothetical protein Tco_0024473 [Tanacetum coccineum]